MPTWFSCGAVSNTIYVCIDFAYGCEDEDDSEARGLVLAGQSGPGLGVPSDAGYAIAPSAGGAVELRNELRA
jgi:hypothetical protein